MLQLIRRVQRPWSPCAAVCLSAALSIACGHGTAAEEQNGGGAKPARECRGPDQPGCNVCCDRERSSGPSPACVLRSVAGGAQDRGEQVGYNDRRIVGGACAPSCPACAACTEDEERAYRRIVEMGCDCFRKTDSLDPCYSDGCACSCQSFADLVDCRELVPEGG